MYIGSKLENKIFYGRKQYYTRLFLMNKTLLDKTIKVGNHVSIKTGPKNTSRIVYCRYIRVHNFNSHTSV